jgi:hypothetical protein
MDESSILGLCVTLLPGTHVFFDRFFTSVQLIENLHSHKIGATGTLMKSRVPKNSKLKDPLPSPSFRRSHNGHLPEIATIKNSAVCRNPGCNKKDKVRCVKCNIFLCLRFGLVWSATVCFLQHEG